MRLRDVYILNAQTLNDSDTVTVNLTKALKILYLRVQYQDKNGATSNTVCRLNGMVSKIAVVDGSDVLHSLSMREEQALNAFTYGHMPFQVLSEDDDIVLVEEALVDFRRYPGDTQFYLDTAKYQNPQLQLTHALTISATAGFVTGQGKVSVIARVIDSGAPSQAGFTMSKEMDSFASTSSGDHNTDLPLDFPISGILIQAPVDANAPDTYISNIKLTQDFDAYIPVNMSMADLLRQNLDQYGEFQQRIDILEDTTATLLGDLYYRTRGWAGPTDGTAKAFVSAVVGNQLSVVMTTGGAAGLGASLVGQAPHGSVFYEFGDGNSADQVYNPQGVGKFQLKVTGAATGATVKVVTSQLHP
jgi:hypothetical protein